MGKRTNIVVGGKHGCLTAISETDRRYPNGGVIWQFKCDCGVVIERVGYAVADAIRKGLSPSAGPCLDARKGKHFKKHGGSKNPAYYAYCAAKNRCTNPAHPNWARYGGRGIRFDERWDTFETFWRDMGSTWQKGLTLDRIDNDGPYSPENCRWLSRRAQYMNTRIKIPVDLVGLAKERGCSVERLRSRWRSGRSPCGKHNDPDRDTWPIVSAEELIAKLSRR
jgi:hypothetical protein